MTAHDRYRLTKPCDNCPFRSDVRTYIRPASVDEIEVSLVHDQFSCHKTVVDYTEPRDRSGEVHCAGALILLEKIARPSQMMRIAERLGASST